MSNCDQSVVPQGVALRAVEFVGPNGASCKPIGSHHPILDLPRMIQQMPRRAAGEEAGGPQDAAARAVSRHLPAGCRGQGICRGLPAASDLLMQIRRFVPPVLPRQAGQVAGVRVQHVLGQPIQVTAPAARPTAQLPARGALHRRGRTPASTRPARPGSGAVQPHRTAAHRWPAPRPARRNWWWRCRAVVRPPRRPRARPAARIRIGCIQS